MHRHYVPAGVKQVFSRGAGMWRSERPQALNFGGPNFDIEDYARLNVADEHYAEVFGFPALGRAIYGGVKLRF